MQNQLMAFQLPDIKRNGDSFGQLERVEAMINVTKDLYQISQPKADKPAEYGIMASGYAKMNQVANVSFTNIQVLENTRDVASAMVEGVYYNASGERVEETDVVTLNFPLLHEAMRLKAKDTKGHWIWEGKGKKKEKIWEKYQECKTEIIYQDGRPIITLVLDPKIEMEIYQKILHLRVMGIKKAITVAKNRIIKRATGVFKVELPIEMHTVTQNDYGTTAVLKDEVHIPVVGYRSPATNSQVQAAIKQLFGGKQEPKDITLVMTHDIQEEILQETNADSDSELDEIINPDDPAEELTTEEEPAINCEGDDCGRVIESTEKFTAEAIASFSKRKFKKILCLGCQKKESKKEAK